jgi:hypothetical protein
MSSISSNNFRHPVTKTFTTLHYTSANYTSLRFITLVDTSLHFITLVDTSLPLIQTSPKYTSLPYCKYYLVNITLINENA